MKQKTILLGVTSGIAAYKTLDLIALLRKEGHNVLVIMTQAATKMLPPKELEKASGNPVVYDMFPKDFQYKKVLASRSVDHIALADTADLMVIAPTTANTLAKLAHGIADNLLTTTALAVTAPIMLCPSMNVHMWENPAIQDNLFVLKKRSFHIINPESGMLACGYEGMGKLANVNTIFTEIKKQLTMQQSFQGKKILVTAGGTTEKIDDVRYITNRSSGKMGAAIAEEYARRGADVLLLRAATAVRTTHHIKEKTFSSSEDLLALLKNYVTDYDYIYHTAAVSDFAVSNKITGKISSKKAVTLHLKPQVKILDQIKKMNPNIRLIAFKAESLSDRKKLTAIAYKRLKEAGAAAIVANDISKNDRGFGTETNEVSIILADGSSTFIPLQTKQQVAHEIIDYVTQNIT
ncbi:MAG: bifunctional phosphopantothenoylcysteine decarboxylase/phosphopantothenate--cysteine ligase CoaBC [Patescibacteria group bacterium]